MNVIELRDALNDLIAKGHGELPVCYLWRDKMDYFDHWEIDKLELAADFDDPNKQVIEIE